MPTGSAVTAQAQDPFVSADPWRRSQEQAQGVPPQRSPSQSPSSQRLPSQSSPTQQSERSTPVAASRAVVPPIRQQSPSRQSAAFTPLAAGTIIHSDNGVVSVAGLPEVVSNASAMCPSVALTRPPPWLLKLWFHPKSYEAVLLSSLNHLPPWLAKLLKNCGNVHIPKHIVTSKVPLGSPRDVADRDSVAGLVEDYFTMHDAVTPESVPDTRGDARELLDRVARELKYYRELHEDF